MYPEWKFYMRKQRTVLFRVERSTHKRVKAVVIAKHHSLLVLLKYIILSCHLSRLLHTHA